MNKTYNIDESTEQELKAYKAGYLAALKQVDTIVQSMRTPK